MVAVAAGMERETELTQAWSPEKGRGVEKGGMPVPVPLQLVGGELRTFSLPVPQDDDGTDISLKDWQLGPRSDRDRGRDAAPYAVKPFKGSVRTRFTPIEEDLSGPSSPDHFDTPRAPSSPDHFDTPFTPRPPRTSSSNSASPPKLLHDTESTSSLRSTDSEAPPTPDALERSGTDPNSKSARSLRVSFVERAPTPPRAGPPVVRHRSPLKSRSLHPPKEAKSLQPKWESSTRITHPLCPPQAKPLAPARRKSAPPAPPPRAAVAPLHEIESEFPGSSGYLSDGRVLSSNRDLTMSPVRSAHRHDVEDDEDTRVGMLCGGGRADTKLTTDFVRLVSKLCRVPVPKQPASRARSSATWEPEPHPVIGRRHSLQLLSERCSTAPAPTYAVPKARKIRTHEPHVHFYRSISKTLDQKLRS